MRLPLLAVLLATALFTTTARAQTAPSLQGQAPPTEVDRYGWQIVGTDLAALALGVAAANATEGYSLLAYPLAAPVVHVAHRNGVGAIGSLALRISLPLAGAYAGYRLEQGTCGQGEWFCGLGGFLLGGLAGMATATVVDAALLARVERPVKRSNLPVPTLAISPRGGFMLGLAGRL